LARLPSWLVRCRTGPLPCGMWRGPYTGAQLLLVFAVVTMSARVLRVVSAAAAVAGVGLLVWWFTVGQNANSITGETALTTPIATPAPAETAAAAAPTAIPTPTPVPSPTPIPKPLPFPEAVPLGDLLNDLISPLPDCGLLRNDRVVAGTITLQCIEDYATVPVVAAADGRVVNVVTAEAAIVPEALRGIALMTPGWSWANQAELGPHVVIDHGPIGTSSNSQTVYAGLAAIEEEISVGAMVSAGQPIATIVGPSPSLQFSLWSGDTRQDGARVLAEGPSFDEQLAAAEALRPIISSPTDERCPLVLGFGQLPGAPRQYRNGTHRGIDFGCGAAERSGYAIADGTVVYLVDDYQDPTVPEREALLQLASIAGFTPHWTLVMLYGNVVVVDHGEIAGAGRVVTITAHLEEVDPAIALGAPVTKGQRLGELGNRGTNASALGIRGASDPSLHLHWELFIDNWYLGSNQQPGAVSQLIATALCGPAATAGCPA